LVNDSSGDSASSASSRLIPVKKKEEDIDTDATIELEDL